RLLAAVFLKINLRRIKTEMTLCRIHLQTAVGGHGKILSLIQTNCDLAIVSAGSDNKVVLQAAMVPVKNDVNPGINFRIPHPSEVGDAAVPVIRVIAQ